MAAQPVLQTDWADFPWFIKEYIPRQTVPILKTFAQTVTFHAKIDCYARSSDRKGDIVLRIQDAFQRLKVANDLDKYGRARLNCERQGQSVHRPSYHGPPPTFGGVPAPPPPASSSGSYNRSSAWTPSAATNGHGGQYSAAGPSKAPASNWSSSSTATAYSRPVHTLQDWKPNPMWKPIKALTSMETLPDISHNENSHVRRERRSYFNLPPDVIEKLNYTREHPHAHPRYAVRLFCTSSDHFRPPGMPIYPGQVAPTNRNIPIEFPSNPDITVDNHNLSFKEKGLRGKAGSAPPFDMEKGPNGLPRVSNRPIYVTMGHSGPTVGKKKDQAKRFFYQIVFAEMTSKEELLKRLQALEPTTVAASLAEFRKRQEENDDIIIGQSVLSLKDPLSYMRITRPVRSSRCTHMQCFDATWWIESNSLHPQWLCPHCNKELHFGELIVDGYVLSILNSVPDSFDDVVLEPTGEWHSEDNKYGSAAWLSENGASVPPDAPKIEAAPSPQSTDTPEGNGNTKRKIVEILLSDSEDEDDDSDRPLAKVVNGSHRTSASSSVPPPRLPPTAPPSNAAVSSSRSSVQPVNDIIDLTLSDSDDDTDEQEDPSSSQPNFQPPGAGYANRNAVDLRRPLQQSSQGDPVARQGQNGSISSSTNVNGFSGRGTNAGTSADEWDALYESPWPNDPWKNSNPPAMPRSMSASSSSSGTKLKSILKRPRADDWPLNGSLNQPKGANTNSDTMRSDIASHWDSTAGKQRDLSTTTGGFSGYSGIRTSAFGAQPHPSSSSSTSTEPLLSKFGSTSTLPNKPQPLSIPRPTPTASDAPSSNPNGKTAPIMLRIPAASSLARSAVASPVISGSNGRENGHALGGHGLGSGSGLPSTSSNSGFRSGSNSGEMDMDIDVDDASLELGPRSAVVSPSSPRARVTSGGLATASDPDPNRAFIYPDPESDKEQAVAHRNIDQPPPLLNDLFRDDSTVIPTRDQNQYQNKRRYEDDDIDAAERSSDLGLGIGEVQDEFWEGVLNGDLSLRDID